MTESELKTVDSCLKIADKLLEIYNEGNSASEY
jgi:hypothetical protein